MLDLYDLFFAGVAADITIPAGKWIIGNVDYMGFYRTNYDVGMWKKLISQLKTDHTVSPIYHNTVSMQILVFTDVENADQARTNSI